MRSDRNLDSIFEIYASNSPYPDPSANFLMHTWHSIQGIASLRCGTAKIAIRIALGVGRQQISIGAIIYADGILTL